MAAGPCQEGQRERRISLSGKNPTVTGFWQTLFVSEAIRLSIWLDSVSRRHAKLPYFSDKESWAIIPSLS